MVKSPWFMLALGAIALSGCTATESPSVNSNALPLGVALAQTGNAALYGQEQLQGVRVAEEFFNQSGQIKGRTLRLVIQDTGSDEAGAVNVFQTLINGDRVIGIVGPTLSQQAFSADPIAEQAGVPVVAPSNTARGIPEMGAFISRVSAGVEVVAPTAIQAALEINPNIRRVAVFFAQDDAFSRSETEIFQKAIREHPKLELVTVQQTQTTDTNFQAQINATLSLKPDLIVISGLAADGGNLIRQLRELGYQGLILGGNGVNTVNIFPVCRRLCNGVLVAQAYNSENPDPMNVKFRNAFAAKYSQAPSQFSAQAFTAVQVFADSLARLSQAKNLSELPLADLRQALNQEILKGVYETPLGEIRFTPQGEVLQRFFYVGQIEMSDDGQSGKFRLVKRVERQP
ncbi:ABC transporter substrate-binding protein [Thermosynechococcus vestitus]|uniref:Branched-chain amino acid ABC transporter periplasmic amino acid-binding protein n=1 Tax=Thermosynechococcus vestitus (strain NIES-2133 / IAM M-273 / BP-1) TaxID=197221 RepID=Q8DKI0_THEVB|nr:ABC transporter substrate-binding protein [Thermosynechococcus vestitus]BAC08431.1 branched-chain amino acid ABC transporter periplasmic amino acid-binding protein [Thermosynechococcus vestitus BP-1]